MTLSEPFVFLFVQPSLVLYARVRMCVGVSITACAFVCVCGVRG